VIHAFANNRIASDKMPRTGTITEFSMHDNPAILNLFIHNNGEISTDTTGLTDPAALRAWLSEAARQQPQPEVHIHVTELDSYEIVGKVIYQTQAANIKTVKCFGGEFLS
jgi:biopolymer transport protein ExbD